MTTQITITVPFSLKPNQILASTTPEENAFILELGCNAFTVLQKGVSQNANDAIYKSLKEAAREDFLKKEQIYQQEFTKVQSQLETLKQRLEQENILRRDVEQTIRQQEASNRLAICQEKDARIADLAQQNKRLQEMIDTSIKASNKELAADFTALKDNLLRLSSNSQVKGKAAESIFTDLLQRVFGNVPIGEEFSIQNLGQQEAHKGDIHMVWRKSLIMWEVKNYTRQVDAKEVNKFHQDMQTNPEIAVGILVSMNTGIQGHTKAGDIDIAPMPDGRMCIYINNFGQKDDPQYYLQSLQPFIEVFCLIHKQSKAKMVVDDEDNSYELEAMKKNMQTITLMLQEHLKKDIDLRNICMTEKKKAEDCWNKFIMKIKEQEHSTKNMLKCILSLEESDDTLQSNKKENEDLFFKQFEWAVLDDEQKKFVECIRKNFSFAEDKETPSKDVREALKVDGLSEKQILKYQESLVLEDAWRKGSVKVKYVVKI